MLGPKLRLRGRPRKHANAADRVKAFRQRRELTKITIDVPKKIAESIKRQIRLVCRGYAEEIASENPEILWMKYKDSNILFCDLDGYRLEIKLSDDPYKWPHEWRVFVDSRQPLAGGFTADQKLAQSLAEAVLIAYRRYRAPVAR